MNVSEGLYIVNTLLKEKKNVPEIVLEEWNDLLDISNNLVATKKLAQKKAEALKNNMTFEEYLAIDEDFRTLKTTAAITLTTGIGNLPADYLKYISVLGTLSSIVRDVDIINDKEMNKRKYNVFGLLEYHPACVIDSIQISVFPTNVSGLNMTYIKRPTKPVYAETINATTGLNTYNSAGSTQWDWTVHIHPEIILEILNLLGISASYEDVKKYIER
jgi:hypothetical protein